MLHSAPRGAAFAVPVPAPLVPAAAAPQPASALPKPALPVFPRGARPVARPPRPAFLTRRYETSWLAADGMVETATRIAPALPAFEEAFSAIARGALIETAEGLVAIEDLAPGATVIAADGRRERVVWIGAMTLFPPQSVPGIAPASLTRITADAFGDGRPMPDLLLGPQARIVLQGARCQRIGTARASVPARSLVDGEGIVAVTPVAPVTVYHLVLSRHAALRCAGVEVESFHPGKDHAERFDPQMAQLFLAMFPTLKSFADFGPLALPRLSADEALDLIAA